MWRTTIKFSLGIVVTNRADASQMRSPLPGRLDTGISAFHVVHVSATLNSQELTPLFLPKKMHLYVLLYHICFSILPM